MSQSVGADILAGLDAERRALGTPSAGGDVFVERSADRSKCRIVFASCPPEEIDDLIRRERDAAGSGGYSLEWKYYGHDTPADLPERLVAAGFEAGDEEQVLVLALDEAALAAFGDGGGHEIRIVRDERDLADYAEVVSVKSGPPGNPGCQMGQSSPETFRGGWSHDAGSGGPGVEGPNLRFQNQPGVCNRLV